MKEVKHKYQKVLTTMNELEKDWIHRLITKSAMVILRNDKEDLDEKEAYAAAALERLSLIKSAVNREDEEDDESDSESDSNNDSDSSSSSSSSDDDSNDDTFFVDLFLEVVEEHYPEEEDTYQKARDIVKDKNEMGVILPIIMKKYRKFIKIMNKLKRSDTHMSIESTKDKLGMSMKIQILNCLMLIMMTMIGNFGIKSTCGNHQLKLEK